MCKGLKVRKHFVWLSFIGWLGMGISLFSFGMALILLFVENRLQLVAFVIVPLAILSVMLLLEQYLPWVHRFSQHTIKETIGFCVTFFGAAKKSIIIASGWLSPVFYGDNRIIGALKSAKKRGVKIQIAFGYRENAEQEAVIDKLSFLEINDELIAVTSPVSGPHFMVVDRLHMRVEQDHHLSSDSGRHVEPLEIKNRVQYCSPIAALGLTRRFSDLTKNRKAINSDRINERIG